MKPAKQIEEEFRYELSQLLLKYKADLDITDDGRPYGFQSGVARVSISAEFDKEGNTISEYCEFEL